jgi:hypothetical protein
MRVYLNRFLNIPPVPLPKQTKRVERSINADDSMSKDPEALLREELLYEQVVKEKADPAAALPLHLKFLTKFQQHSCPQPVATILLSKTPTRIL